MALDVENLSSTLPVKYRNIKILNIIYSMKIIYVPIACISKENDIFEYKLI